MNDTMAGSSSPKQKAANRPAKKFKPAEGASDASDFIVRTFAARLRTGMTVIKHSRSRYSKSKSCLLTLQSDRILNWKRLASKANNKKKGKRGRKSKPKGVDLARCHEVRHAWTIPESCKNNKKLAGTSVLRKRCGDDWEAARRSFSLIFANRTLDLTAETSDQARVMLEGFSALCFRLQMESMDGGRSLLKKVINPFDGDSCNDEHSPRGNKIICRRLSLQHSNLRSLGTSIVVDLRKSRSFSSLQCL